MPRLPLLSPLVALTLLLLSTFILPAEAAILNGALGCVTTSSITAKATGSGGLSVKQTSQDSCIAYCKTSGLYTYAGYATTVLTGSNNCFCLKDAATVDASAFSVPTGQSVLCTALGATALVDIKTTFVYSTCYAPTSLLSDLVSVVSGTLGIGVASPDQCFQQCSGSTGAYIAPYLSILGTPTYGCVCAGSGVSIIGIATACGLGNFIEYIHPAAAQASNLARRQVKAQAISVAGRKEVVRERNWECPRASMMACRVQGHPDAWECVEPMGDLESCGGCPYGDYVYGDNTNTTATGIDCTSMPGLLRGSSTCLNGRCQALACKRGWTLVNSVCARL